MSTRRLHALLLCTLALLWGRPGRAEGDVDALIEQGVSLRESGNDTEALSRFRRAFELSKGARAQAQMALAEQALGDWVRAEVDLTAALAASDDPWIKTHEAPLREALATIREHLGDLEVLGGVTGAEVILDGTPVGKVPLQRPVRSEIGTRTLEVRAPGYYPINKSVQITQNGTSRVSLAMVPLAEQGAAPPPEAVGTQRREPLPAGLPGEAASPEEPPVLAWVAAGSAVALAGLGVAGLVVRNGSIGDYNDDPACPGTKASPQPTSCQDRIDSSKTWTTVSVIGFVGAGLAGGAAAYLFLTPKKPESQSAGVACGVSFLSPGVLCRGAF